MVVAKAAETCRCLIIYVKGYLTDWFLFLCFIDLDIRPMHGFEHAEYSRGLQPKAHGHILFGHIQGYSYVPPGFPNSTAQQPRHTAERSVSIGRESLQVFLY